MRPSNLQQIGGLRRALSLKSGAPGQDRVEWHLVLAICSPVSLFAQVAFKNGPGSRSPSGLGNDSKIILLLALARNIPLPFAVSK
jgi:hypothetical protein